MLEPLYFAVYHRPADAFGTPEIMTRNGIPFVATRTEWGTMPWMLIPVPRATLLVRRWKHLLSPGRTRRRWKRRGR